MAGRKLFRNQTPHSLHVTLMIRASEDPRRSAGTREFGLPPHGAAWQEYGNHVDIYLNGIALRAHAAEAMIAQQHFVVARGSELDNLLNSHNGVDFSLNGDVFQIRGREVD